MNSACMRQRHVTHELFHKHSRKSQAKRTNDFFLTIVGKHYFLKIQAQCLSCSASNSGPGEPQERGPPPRICAQTHNFGSRKKELQAAFSHRAAKPENSFNFVGQLNFPKTLTPTSLMQQLTNLPSWRYFSSARNAFTTCSRRRGRRFCCS